MQVKKFEARTMKEALEMVKTQLGPDAIILNARDNSKSFGLVGNTSYEITAAVSEETLQKKKYAESKLKEQEKEKYLKTPARLQKQFIDKAVSKALVENEAHRPITSTRYIDIFDEEERQPVSLNSRLNAKANNYSKLSSLDNSNLPAKSFSEASDAKERIRKAAQRAWNVMVNHSDLQLEETPNAPSREATNTLRKERSSTPLPQEVQSAPGSQTTHLISSYPKEFLTLQEDLTNLRKIMSQFQNIPQNFNSSQQFPGSDFGLPYDLSFMFEKLIQAGLLPEISAELLLGAKKQMPPVKFKNKTFISSWIAKAILNTTLVSSEKEASKIQLFFGPSGLGKTSSLIKLASHNLIKTKKKIILLSCDTMKIGAIDQMRIFAQILNVPFAVIRNANDWKHILSSLKDFDFFFCDYPGFSLKKEEELRFLKGVLPPDNIASQKHLVLSANSKDAEMFEIGKRYKEVPFTDVIFTGLDETIQFGSIYNFMVKFKTPIHSYGIGPKVPEDYELASKERMLDLIFKLNYENKSEVA